MTPLLAEEALTATAVPPIWPLLVIAGLLVLVVVVLWGIFNNTHRSLGRLTAIRKHVEESKHSGVVAQMQEAIVQLQSLAVSLDRVAMRCDHIDQKIAEASAKGLGGGDSGLAQAVAALREGLDQLRTPVGEIRDLIGKSEVERLNDEVKRTLYSMGYDQVALRTDLGSLVGGDGKAHVEVSKTGIKSKGYLTLRGGSVIEVNISPTYEMFP